MEKREGIVLKIVAPSDRFISADDLIAALDAEDAAWYRSA